MQVCWVWDACEAHKGRACRLPYCNQPRVLQSSSDCHTLVSVGTGPNSIHSFVLPSMVPCMISIGAASCSLAQASLPCYRCLLSCSLYCIGMTCGSPCSSPNYQTSTWFSPRPLVKSLLYQYIMDTSAVQYRQVESSVSILHRSFLLPEGLAKGLARQEPL